MKSGRSETSERIALVRRAFRSDETPDWEGAVEMKLDENRLGDEPAGQARPAVTRSALVSIISR